MTAPSTTTSPTRPHKHNRAKQEGFTGYNLDFEPTVSGTPDDAQKYAEFLDYFAKRLHAHNLQLTVDVAGWNTLWNFTEISLTSIDHVFDMSTYTGE